MEIIIRGKDNCLCYKAAEFKIEKGQEIVVSNGIVAYSYIDGRFDARMVAGRQLPWDKSFLKENHFMRYLQIIKSLLKLITIYILY